MIGDCISWFHNVGQFEFRGVITFEGGDGDLLVIRDGLQDVQHAVACTLVGRGEKICLVDLEHSNGIRRPESTILCSLGVVSLSMAVGMDEYGEISLSGFRQECGLSHLGPLAPSHAVLATDSDVRSNLVICYVTGSPESEAK